MAIAVFPTKKTSNASHPFVCVYKKKDETYRADLLDERSGQYRADLLDECHGLHGASPVSAPISWMSALMGERGFDGEREFRLL